MTHRIWEAKLTEEEWERVEDKDLDQMCDGLETAWEDIKDDHLKERGAK